MQKRDCVATVEHDTESPLRQHGTTMQANSPNQSMKRIAAGVKTSFDRIEDFSVSSASLPAAIRLSLSR